MRDLKFRAWNSALEEMDYSPRTVFGSENKLNSINDHFIYAERECGFVFMQYTGLKDKNGKEVFEGDVGRCILHYPKGHSQQYGDIIGEVTFKDGGYWMGKEVLTNTLAGEIEVAGNIYENPELLKDTTK